MLRIRARFGIHGWLGIFGILVILERRGILINIMNLVSLGILGRLGMLGVLLICKILNQ